MLSNVKNSLSDRNEAEALFAAHVPQLRQKMDSLERIIDCVIEP
jgi:hypothetical protein